MTVEEKMSFWYLFIGSFPKTISIVFGVAFIGAAIFSCATFMNELMNEPLGIKHTEALGNALSTTLLIGMLCFMLFGFVGTLIIQLILKPIVYVTYWMLF